MRFVTAIVLSLLASPLAAAELRIGYLSLDDDPRYTPTRAELRIDPDPHGNGLAGAQLGVADSAPGAQAAGLTITLDAQSGRDAASLQQQAASMSSTDPVILLDLPAGMLAAVAPLLSDTFGINVSATEDSLRCLPGLLHAAPSDRMLSDALAQFLVARNWKRVLVLTGPAPRDAELVAAFTAAADRYRLQIVDTRTFTLAADPEHRDIHDPVLLTGNLDYDAVYIADSGREFGPYLPYATALPRPVIGSDGLVLSAWHWAFDLYGAPQVNARFIRAAHRHMADADWSAWVAVKAVIAAAQAGTSLKPDSLRAALTSDAMAIDGSKGTALNFRAWDGQLRMPILLGTPDAVIAIAPFEGFAHEVNTLDALGTNAPEMKCP